MKITRSITYIAFASLVFLGTNMLAYAQAASITTVTCNTTCAPSFSNYIGTAQLVLVCDASSPASYTGQLTVNGVSTILHTQLCPVITLPVVTATPVTSVTQTTASSGGTTVSDGGATVTVSGIAWSTALNPTTLDAHTTDGWAIGGPWVSNMTGLAANTTYHVRAYATNSVGTAYSADVMFTTLALTTCTLPWGGSITSGSSVTAYQTSSVTAPASCTLQSRTCTNGTLSGSYVSQSCTVIPAPIDGSCGSAATPRSTKPTGPTLCATGNPSSVSPTSGNGPWTWICAGSNGGITVSCTAPYSNVSGAICPNAVCEGAKGENPITCPQDCRVRYKTF